ncbi:hypothetical protein O181_119147 [Austropuccinia psidii MF-1]|uniref:Uncharacterized protein n=1 Tax=Austropuccinia psidii MF-1 TaxID=1389203 RepID=A0A9Q3KEI3_9BASI|nr:hypothetical protein [Austropuccinia psidii MF-1]
MVDGKTLREIIPTLSFTFQFNSNPKPEESKYMDQVLQLHKLLKDLFQWSMDNKRFNLAPPWAEPEASCHKLCLKEIDFKDVKVITKEEQLTQTGHTQIPSGSQGAGQISSPVASHHSETNRSVAKSHHSSQSQEGLGEDKDTRAKTRPPLARGRESQTQ